MRPIQLHPPGQPKNMNPGPVPQPPQRVEDSPGRPAIAEVAHDPVKAEKPLKTPRRKVLASATGGGLGIPISIILAYHFPAMDETVTLAYSGLIVVLLGFIAGYLAEPEKD